MASESLGTHQYVSGDIVMTRVINSNGSSILYLRMSALQRQYTKKLQAKQSSSRLLAQARKTENQTVLVVESHHQIQ